MPRQAETKRLLDSIEVYAAAELTSDVEGRFTLTEAHDNHIPKILAEIQWTKRSRRITFYAAGKVLFEVVAQNGRLFELHLGGTLDAPFHAVNPAEEEAQDVAAALERAVSGCGGLSVSYTRLQTPLDDSAPALLPSCILKFWESRPLNSNPSSGGAVETLTEPKNSTGQSGGLTGTSDSHQLETLGSPEISEWLEELNEGLFEEIELCTSDGRKLTLDYGDKPVRILLSQPQPT